MNNIHRLLYNPDLLACDERKHSSSTSFVDMIARRLADLCPINELA